MGGIRAINLKELREAAGFTVPEAAIATGIPYYTYKEYERGAGMSKERESMIRKVFSDLEVDRT